MLTLVGDHGIDHSLQAFVPFAGQVPHGRELSGSPQRLELLVQVEDKGWSPRASGVPRGQRVQTNDEVGSAGDAEGEVFVVGSEDTSSLPGFGVRSMQLAQLRPLALLEGAFVGHRRISKDGDKPGEPRSGFNVACEHRQVGKQERRRPVGPTMYPKRPVSPTSGARFMLSSELACRGEDILLVN